MLHFSLFPRRSFTHLTSRASWLHALRCNKKMLPMKRKRWSNSKKRPTSQSLKRLPQLIFSLLRLRALRPILKLTRPPRHLCHRPITWYFPFLMSRSQAHLALENSLLKRHLNPQPTWNLPKSTNMCRRMPHPTHRRALIAISSTPVCLSLSSAKTSRFVAVSTIFLLLNVPRLPFRNALPMKRTIATPKLSRS